MLVRIIEQFANIKTYFLNELPKTGAFKGKNGVVNTNRYKRIAECMKDTSLMALMAFVVFVAQDFKKFLVPLQTNAPKIHVLHSMKVKLVHLLMSKFIASKYITNEATKKMLGAAELMKVDVLDKKIHIAKVQVGAKATTEMKNLGALEKKKTVTVMVGFLESCTKYLLNNLPLDNNVIKSAKCLHPENRHQKSALTNISYLIQVVIKALGDDAMHKAFHSGQNKTKYDLIDKIRSQFQQYQMESIDESFYKYNETSKKDTYTQKTLYWKDAYKIAGICSDDDNSNDGVFKRLVEY